MRLKRWVNELVDLGALQSGAYRLDLAPVKVAAFVAACLEAEKPLAERVGVALEGGLAVAAPPILHTDEERLRRLTMILLDRAVVASRSGCVSLVARSGEPTSGEDEKMCAGECLELVFGDFGRASPPASGLPGGSARPGRSGSKRGNRAGLSLALAARLSAALGGRLVVEETAGAAPRFVVRLPLGIPVADRVAEDPAWSPVFPTGV